MNEEIVLNVKQDQNAGLYEDILHHLQKRGVDLKKITRSGLSEIDEFHKRRAEVTEELVSKFAFRNLTVLDVGCGIGGTCRMMAEKFNCVVSGIDNNEEFISTAKKLSSLVGLEGKTIFVQGDALDMPYRDNFFDVVWTQHVQMNIKDKLKFYSEIYRVLKGNGSFIYYDIFSKGNGGEINYPAPWANTNADSFLDTLPKMQFLLSTLGFSKTHTTDQTSKDFEFLRRLLNKKNGAEEPQKELNAIMDASSNEKLRNVLQGIEENKIEFQSGVYKKRKKVEEKVYGTF